MACAVLQVGSILFTAEEGKTYEKGDELGYFAFGGSTCIAIFQRDTVVVDEDIISNRSACTLHFQYLIVWEI